MKKYIYFLGLLFLGVVACNNDDAPKLDNDIVENDVEDENTNSNNFDYAIPSPSDQFKILSRLDGTKNVSAVFSVDSLKNFVESDKQAVAFGIYTADLAYLTSFKEGMKSLAYVSAIEKLAEDLGVDAIFNAEIRSSVEKNKMNSDSMFMIADKTYLGSMNKMIENEKGNELALMLVGGWIESMYLSFKTSKGFDKSPKINKYIAGQKATAENLMTILLDYQDNAAVKSKLDMLVEVIEIMDQMNCENSEPNMSKDAGKKVLSGGMVCSLDKNLYTQLENKILEIRNNLITK